MGLYRKRKVWWFIKQYKGHKVEESLGTDNKRLAEKKYAYILPKILDGSYFEKQLVKITFKELEQRYMEKHAKTRDQHTVKRLLPYFGNLLIDEIEIKDVEDYIDDRLSAGAAYSTVYKEFALARRMFNVARKKWRRDYGAVLNPFADAGFPSFDNARERWLTLDEESKLLNAASPEWVKDIITFAIHTGCRRGEILDLHTKDIDMRRGIITV